MVPLGEVAELVRRTVSPEPDASYTEIGIRSFFNGTFHRRTLTGAEFSWQKLFLIRSGDLIFSNLMAWEGAVAVAQVSDEGCVGNHRMLTCEVDADRALPRYVLAFLKTEAGMRQITAASPGSIARNKTLSPSLMSGILVPVPPLDVQRRVVERLEVAETRIAQRRSAAGAVVCELDALLAAAFRRITKDAPRARMGDVAPLVRRSVMIDPEASYTEIGVRSFFKGAFHRRTVSGAEFTWQKLFRVNEGDLIFSNLMAWEKGIALAGAADDGCVGNHRMLTCEADRDRLVPGFLWFYFTTDEGFAQVVAASPGTIARNKTLSAEELPNITVPVPSLDAQRWFDALQQKARAAREAQAAAAAELDHLVPALLAEAFGSG
jgi:type I restriction enzyme S subunit